MLFDRVNHNLENQKCLPSGNQTFHIYGTSYEIPQFPFMDRYIEIYKYRYTIYIYIYIIHCTYYIYARRIRHSRQTRYDFIHLWTRNSSSNRSYLEGKNMDLPKDWPPTIPFPAPHPSSGTRGGATGTASSSWARPWRSKIIELNGEFI